MVESAVEFHLVGSLVGFYLYPAELLLPAVVSLLSGFVKAQRAGLALTVVTGIVNRSVGNANLGSYLFVLLGTESKVHTSSYTCYFFRASMLFATDIGAIGGWLFVEGGREVDGYGGARLIYSHIFWFCNDITFHQSVVGYFYHRIFYHTALAHASANAEENMTLVALGEGVSLQHGTFSSCQFGSDAVVYQ